LVFYQSQGDWLDIPYLYDTARSISLYASCYRI
jgi:hypothetical protein